MYKIIIVRHGETLWNKEMRYQGHTDIELSEIGIKQAEAVAKRLKHENIKKIYSSDLKRAFTTAKIISSYHNNVKIQKMKSLREINYGVWEGMLLKDVREKYGDLLNKWWENPYEVNIPSGESLKEFAKRINYAVKRILKNIQSDILIVSHGGAIRIIILAILNLDFSVMRNFRQDNTSVNIIEINEDRKVLTLLNDTCHLSNFLT